MGLTVDCPAATASAGTANAEPTSTTMTTSRSTNRRPERVRATTCLGLGRGVFDDDDGRERARADPSDRSGRPRFMSSPGTDDSVDEAPLFLQAQTTRSTMAPHVPKTRSTDPIECRFGVSIADIHIGRIVHCQGAEMALETCRGQGTTGFGAAPPLALGVSVVTDAVQI